MHTGAGGQGNSRRKGFFGAGRLPRAAPSAPKFGRPHAEERPVKGPYAILGIGLVGCLALAWMARQVQTKSMAPRQDRASAARPTYQAHLVAPATSRIERQGNTPRRFVTAYAVPSADRKQLAEWIARETQATSYGALQGCAVHVTVYGEEGAPPQVFELPARPVTPPPKPASAPAAPAKPAASVPTRPATPR
jgi:hypothetical protein